eukprot:CAMPEP_0180181638 /NCGR_PEP_ID=MMETSP0986-20121125/40228_1 /TAXON_ID=697907 /ORGANISM="non described non described, Strain CCMP2293" /LENGTH=49 /DNA_ID= /DNA_START= /DNA_END= /DNA_ORIENTATION=
MSILAQYGQNIVRGSRPRAKPVQIEAALRKIREALELRLKEAFEFSASI